MPVLSEEIVETIKRAPVVFSGFKEDRRENRITRALSGYVRLTPLLWASGLLAPLGMALLAGSLFRKAHEKRIGAAAFLWWLVGFMQAISVLVNWFDTGSSVWYFLYRLSSATVSGWFFLGAAIGVGQVYRLNSPKVVRAICLLGLYLLVLGTFSFGLGLMSGIEKLFIPSPIGLLLPKDLPATEYAFTMNFFTYEEILGKRIPRLILFYPWAVCLGFAGIAVCFIALCEKRLWWRRIGFSGGVMAVVGSMSRAAAIALLAAGVLYIWQTWHPRYRWATVSLLCIVAVTFLSLDKPVVRHVSQFYDAMADLRPGSSDARQAGYYESKRRFLRSPLIGHGWPGDYLSDAIPMPVGSHSTVYGLLYTGGLFTFIPFCVAMLWTLAALFWRARSRDPAARSALSIAVALSILSYGEGIYSFAIPVLFAFCWLGAALRPNNDQPSPVRVPEKATR
jgi:hypothetical protein